MLQYQKIEECAFKQPDCIWFHKYLNSGQHSKLKKHLALLHEVLPSIHRASCYEVALQILPMSYLPTSSLQPAEEKNNW